MSLAAALLLYSIFFGGGSSAFGALAFGAFAWLFGIGAWTISSYLSGDKQTEPSHKNKRS